METVEATWVSRVEARLAALERSNEDMRRSNDEGRRSILRLEGLRVAPAGLVQHVTLPQPADTYDGEVRATLQRTADAIRAAWPRGQCTVQIPDAMRGSVIRHLEDHGYLVKACYTTEHGFAMSTGYQVVWERS